jgi:hypothetical protein
VTPLPLPAAATAAALGAGRCTAPPLGRGAEHTSHALLLGALMSVQRSQGQEPLSSASASAAMAASGGTQPLVFLLDGACSVCCAVSRYCLWAATSAVRLSGSGHSAASCGTTFSSPSCTTWVW